ncbi:MAG: hypothetical protein QOF56_913 [Acidobacteriaceae bacterium]|jgi:hypothetical protein|nr:hypothetical protein [Acidobacteriaceae bacterium]
MSNTAELEALDQIAAKLLQTANKLPPGPERHDLLKEVGKIRSQLFELMAKRK